MKINSLIRKLLIILPFLMFACSIFNDVNSKDLPETVDKVDLKKYTGLWYEITKIPNSFQKQCVKNTTAEYSLSKRGQIKI